jgi:hypothetical protein
MELPSHPDADEPATPRSETKTSWATIIVLGILGALFVVVIVLHLTGVVGPAGH